MNREGTNPKCINGDHRIKVSVRGEAERPLPVVDLNGICIARGDIEGFYSIQKFGHFHSLGTTIATIWPGGASGLYPYLVSATAMTVSSGDGTDDEGGVGATSVEIFGLDGDYNEVNEIIILDGQNPITTDNSYLRVFRAIIRSAGSVGSNVGIIYVGTGTVVSGVPANIFTYVEVGKNQTLQAFYTIPAGKTGYLTKWYVSVGKGKELEADLMVRPFGEVFQIKQQLHIVESPFVVPFTVPLVITEKSDIEVRGSLDSAPAVSVSSSFDLILINN